VQKVRLSALTGVRFFLALWVVLFHQASPEGYLSGVLSKLPVVVFCLFRTGYCAVGVFFVLSGFILSYNYALDHTWSLPQLVRFGIARLARIYPVYCVGLLLVVPEVGYALMGRFSSERVVEQTGLAVLNFTLLQAWIPRVALSWNPPGWSLSDEALFYCCFPFISVALWKLSGFRNLLIAGTLAWAAALIAPLLAVVIGLKGFSDVPATSVAGYTDVFWPYLVKFNPLLHLPDFCMGIVLGRAFHGLLRQRSRLLGRGYYLYLPGVLMEIFLIAHSNSLPYPLVHNGLLLPVHALVILGLALDGGILARLLSGRWLVFLGNASYSLYIIHLPILLGVNMIASRLFSIKLGGVGCMAIYVVAVVCLSAIVFKFIEEPGNRIVKRRLNAWLDQSLHAV